MPEAPWSLWHFPAASPEDADPEVPHILVGFFSSEALGHAVIARLRDLPGFREWPAGFQLLQEVLDRDGWETGFVNSFDDPDWPRPTGREA